MMIVILLYLDFSERVNFTVISQALNAFPFLHGNIGDDDHIGIIP